MYRSCRFTTLAVTLLTTALTVAITVGATQQVFDRIQPYLLCMGAEISHCGGVGNGQVMKLMNNMIIFQNVSALAEAMGGNGITVRDRKALAKAVEDGLAAENFTIISAVIGRQAYDGRL